MGRDSRVIKLLLAFAIACSPLGGFAQGTATQTLAEIQTLPGDGVAPAEHFPMRVRVEAVEIGQEADAVRKIRAHDSEAPISVWTGGRDSRVNASLETLSEQTDPHLDIIRIQQEEALHALQFIDDRNYTPVPSVAKRTGPTAAQKVKNLATGLLVTVLTSSSFGGSYYLVTGDLDVTLKMYAMALVVNGFQIIGTNLWRKYLGLGGLVGKKFHQMMAKVLGQTMSKGTVGENIGRVLSAYGFSVLTSMGVIMIQGAQVSGAWLARNAALATWDAVWDPVIERKVRQGKIRTHHFKQFIAVRLTVAPMVEGFFWSVGPWAMGAATLMGVVGGAGLITLFGEESLSKAKQKFKEQKAQLESEGKTGAWQVLKSMWKKSVPCEEVLKQPAFSQRTSSIDHSSSLPPSNTRTSWFSDSLIAVGSV